MQTRIVARIIAGLAEQRLRLHFVAVVDQDSGSNRAAVGFHALQLHLQPVLLDRRVVSQKRGRLIQVDDQNVQVAVIVEVSEGTSTAAVRHRDSFTSLRLQLFKSTVPQIAKQHSWSLVWILWQLAFDFRIDTAGNEEHVWVAVIVEVNDPRAPAGIPGFDSYLCKTGHFVEVSLPIITVETTGVPDEMSLEQVEMSIEVVVPNPD